MGPGVPCKPGLSGHLHPAFIRVKLAITSGFETEAVVDRPVCAQLVSKKEPVSLVCYLVSDWLWCGGQVCWKQGPPCNCATHAPNRPRLALLSHLEVVYRERFEVTITSTGRRGHALLWDWDCQLWMGGYRRDEVRVLPVSWAPHS